MDVRLSFPFIAVVRTRWRRLGPRGYSGRVDPELVRRVRSGEYVVDPHAVAEAIVRRGGLDEPRPSDVLEAAEADGPGARAEELEPLPRDDLA